MDSDIFRPFRRPVYQLGHPNSGAQKHFSSFFFSVYFNKKYVEVKINDFTLYITILHAANMVYSKVSSFYFLAPRLSFY